MPAPGRAGPTTGDTSQVLVLSVLDIDCNELNWEISGVTIEARLPQMPLFQGSKVPQFSKNDNDAVSLPLSHNFQRILVT